MLKYRINKKNILSDEDRIFISKSDILDIDITNEESFNSKNSIICYTNNLNKISENTSLICYHNVATTFDNYAKTVYSFEETYVVDEINEATGAFSFEADKYIELPIRMLNKADVDEVIEDDVVKTPYLYIYFTQPHFYNLEDTSYIWMYFNGDFIRMGGFECVTNSCIRFKWEDIERDYEEITTLFEDEGTVGDRLGVRFFVENYFFTSVDNFTLYYNNPKCKLTIGLTNKFQIDLQKEYTLNSYISDVKRKSINAIIDMEKDTYYPVIKKDNEYKPIMKIKFNLHFREHRGDNWTVEPTANWNGTKVDESGKIVFIDDYFSYNKKSKQSDLLTYLKFTDSDVRYQKNKLKKSFLRLSFYDSMNNGNQNLLSYSTVFMNSGEYFNKYIRHIEQKPYKSLKYDESGNIEVTDDLKGIRVNREPYNNTAMLNTEEYRLSSQFTVTDKYNSAASSEGFYLYLWRDILENATDDVQGLDIYMKAEFNHAGFGRVIPFMMPYWDKKKWETKEGIKSFEEILNDWNNLSNTDKEYGARQYDKFSYIHFKINYDKNEQKYIYFLDDECYGNNTANTVYDDSTATLTLNLYEAKMV